MRRGSRSSRRRRPRTPRACSTRAIRDPNPVCYMEHKHLYRRIKGEVPDGVFETPFSARVARPGSDLVVIAYGAMVHTALEATEDLDGASIEVLDLRSLVPLDSDAILDSVSRCSKVVIVDEANTTCAAGAQVAALIAERGFEDLDGPVVRVASPDVPIPFSPPLEAAVLPSVDRVKEPAVSSSPTRTRRTLVDVTMPQMGVSVAEGTVVAWRSAGRRLESAPTRRSARSRPTRSTPRCRHRSAGSSPRSSCRSRRRWSARCSRGSPPGAAVATSAGFTTTGSKEGEERRGALARPGPGQWRHAPVL